MRPLIVMLSLAALAGCRDQCALDSDCPGGELCDPSGACVTPEVRKQQLAAPDVTTPEVTAPTDTGSETSEQVGPCGVQPYHREVAECIAPQGVFEPSSGTCAEPTEKHTLRSIFVVPTGGLTRLAPTANPFIEERFESIHIELWSDGDFADGCTPEVVWVTDDETLNADCTPFYEGNFPLIIPFGETLGDSIVQIEQAQFDMETATLTGLVDKEALIASLPEAFQEPASNWVEEDVDTDDDGTPDRASAELILCFE